MTRIRRLALPDVLSLVPDKHGDDRGFFSETFKRAELETEGVRVDWLQDNQSLSGQVGTVRGLHFQTAPFAQDKLVRVLRGAIFDVAVDLREGSQTYGQWVGLELSQENWTQLYVPAGFAHGFMTLLPDTEVLYKVSAPYSKAHEGAILWNDPDLNIAWPEVGPVTLSEKDKVAPRLRDLVALSQEQQS